MQHSGVYVNSGGSNACVGTGGIWEFSVLTAQFCCESKTELKHKVYSFIF